MNTKRKRISARAKEIAEQCRTARIQCGLTTRQLSEITGIQKSRLSSFENGKHMSLYYLLLYESIGVLAVNIK